MATEKTYELKEGAGGHVLRGEDALGNPINKVMQGGDRVRSKKPLDKLFLNKWVCVDDEERKKKVAPAPFSEPVRPARLNNVATAELDGDEDDFVVKADESDGEPEVDEPRGNRIGMSKKTEKEKRRALKKAKAAGTVVNDDSQGEEVAGDDDEEFAEVEEGTEKGSDEPTGKEVTTKIEGAKENALRVFMTPDNHYNVYEADDLKAPLNSAPLSKKAAQKFASNYKG